jgi:Flp pilus assembly CpaE family ATPase
VRALIDFSARHYRYTVIDIPRSDVAVLDSLEGAASIVVVANQELATIRSASRVATALRQRYGKEKVSVVLSRSDRQAEIGLDDLQVALTGGPAHLPSEYRLAVAALNRAQPSSMKGGRPWPWRSGLRPRVLGRPGTADQPPRQGSGCSGG